MQIESFLGTPRLSLNQPCLGFSAVKKKKKTKKLNKKMPVDFSKLTPRQRYERMRRQNKKLLAHFEAELAMLRNVSYVTRETLLLQSRQLDRINATQTVLTEPYHAENPRIKELEQLIVDIKHPSLKWKNNAHSRSPKRPAAKIVPVVSEQPSRFDLLARRSELALEIRLLRREAAKQRALASNYGVSHQPPDMAEIRLLEQLNIVDTALARYQ